MYVARMKHTDGSGYYNSDDANRCLLCRQDLTTTDIERPIYSSGREVNWLSQYFYNRLNNSKLV
jgi:hypothetical protein